MKKYSLLYYLLLLYVSMLLIQKCMQLSLLVSIFHLLWMILCSMIVSMIFYPFVKHLPFSLKWNRKVCIIYSIVFLFLILIGLLIVPFLIQQGVQLYEYYPLYSQYIDDFLQQNNIFYRQLNDLWMNRSTLHHFIQGIINVFNKCFDYLFVYFLSFFITLDLPFFTHKKWLIDKCSSFCYIYDKFSLMIFQYMKGTFIDLCILGLGSYLILFCFGVKEALLYAFLLSISNVIPYIGSIVALIIIAFFTFIQYGYHIWPMLLCLWGFQQLEANFIQTYIFQKVMNVRPSFMFIAFFITQSLLGFWWVLLSPILAVFLQFIVIASMETWKENRNSS